MDTNKILASILKKQLQEICKHLEVLAGTKGQGKVFKYEDLTPSQRLEITPRKGRDYLNDEDIASLVSKVQELIKEPDLEKYFTAQKKKEFSVVFMKEWKSIVKEHEGEMTGFIRKERTSLVESFKDFLTDNFVGQKVFSKLEKKIKDIVKSFGENDFLAIARGLETLKGKDRLDASAIKNLPLGVSNVYSPTIIGAGAVSIERLVGTNSGNNVTLNLLSLASAWIDIVGVFKDGQLLTPSDTQSGWNRVGNTITVLNTDDTASFMVEYTHA